MARPGFPTREDQIDRRRQRAEKGRFRIRNTGSDPVFSIFDVDSESGRTYRVQIRSLTAPENGCTCKDYQANLLGTCKHIEAVLLHIRTRLGKKALEEARPTCAQVYLGFGETVAVRVSRPAELAEAEARLLDRHFDASGVFRGDPVTDLPAFLREAKSPPHDRTGRIQVSDEVLAHVEIAKEALEDRRLLDWYVERVRCGDRSFDLLSKPLYPFQVKGLLHLAFNRRSLLADDMGLGKTVQALAASVLLREIKGVERALVICPASLKHQWAREISRFTSLPAQVVEGNRARRKRAYESPPFFTVMNYELVLRDARDLETFRPDLVILDEAQRIRNWKTRTADAVKALESRYAFVLTGTPLENRLDDVYSIFQFIDPRILGPLWRFNERYFILQRKRSGAYKILGHKNLQELRFRIAPKVLRRRKEDVLPDLPERLDNDYFVDMTPEQRKPYDEFKTSVARLMAKAERKPLTPSEEKSLLASLIKMRLLCNALELHEPGLDPAVRERTCPKVRELARILEDQVIDAGRKALVFSQWEGMVDIARRQVEKLGIGWVKLSGSVPSAKRGALIDRFRDDPDTRVFLSTDAGSVGLNLQPGRLVVNLDVPWNPAVLEQRISRSHRMGQRDVVNVVNLVARDTIEERVLEALEAKREVFEGVFGAEGEAPDRIDLSSKGSLVRTLKAVIAGEDAHPPRPPDVPRPSLPAAPPDPPAREEEPYQALADLVLSRHRGEILLISGSPFSFGKGKVLVVAEGDVAAVRKTVEDAACEVAGRIGLPEPPACAVFDREGYRSLLLLAGEPGGGGRAPLEAWRAPSFTDGMASTVRPGSARRRAAREAQRLIERGRDRSAFARLAFEGGFTGDADGPLRESITGALTALFLMEGAEAEGVGEPDRVEEVLVRPGIVPKPLAAELLTALHQDGVDRSPSRAAVKAALKAADTLLALADERAVSILA